MEEIWKDIPDFEGYQVSNLGRIKSFKYDKINGKIIKTHERNGYVLCSLYRQGKSKTKGVHRLMMETFNPVPNMENLTVNHIDHIRNNNVLSNLEWLTWEENTQDMLDFTQREKTVICLETKQIYKSERECCKQLDILPSGLCQACKCGTTAKGLHFEFYDESKDYSKVIPPKPRFNKRKVYCIELDKTYETLRAAAIELNLWSTNIQKVCAGIYKQTGGYHFKYVD